jgi:hypothetical protein
MKITLDSETIAAISAALTDEAKVLGRVSLKFQIHGDSQELGGMAMVAASEWKRSTFMAGYGPTIYDALRDLDGKWNNENARRRNEAAAILKELAEDNDQ